MTTLEFHCSLRVLNPMCVLGAFPQINTLCLYPGRSDSNDASCCLPAPDRQSEISWAWDLAHCSELCLQWFSVAAAERNSWSLSKYNPFGISLTLITQADRQPQKHENTGQMQAPDLLLVLKSSFALIPALVVLPCIIFLGPFNASACKCKTWLAFVSMLTINSDERNI